jgi:hypothetical protein
VAVATRIRTTGSFHDDANPFPDPSDRPRRAARVRDRRRRRRSTRRARRPGKRVRLRRSRPACARAQPFTTAASGQRGHSSHVRGLTPDMAAEDRGAGISNAAPSQRELPAKAQVFSLASAGTWPNGGARALSWPLRPGQPPRMQGKTIRTRLRGPCPPTASRGHVRGQTPDMAGTAGGNVVSPGGKK